MKYINGYMVNQKKVRNEKTWSSMLNSDKILSDREAKELNNIVLKLRKERGFRKNVYY